MQRVAPWAKRLRLFCGVKLILSSPSARLRGTVSTMPPELPPQGLVDGHKHPLDPRSVTAERVGGWFFSGMMAVPVAAAPPLVALIADLPLWLDAGLVVAALAILAGLAWLAHGWPAVAYRYRSWRLDEEVIEIRRGVLWRRVISVPRSRVQHTDVGQGPVERSLGLSHLVIHTTGTTGASVALAGLDRTTALRIRDHLVDVDDSNEDEPERLAPVHAEGEIDHAG